jgi:xanthine dehydrogenase accessory factor
MIAREEHFALVTVVRRQPPSSARVGDAALITTSGEYHGWAGGGCTRETVVREALRAISDGEPRFLSLSPAAATGFATTARAGMVALPMTCDSGGTVEIYVEPILPASRLVLFGASPAVRVLARIGHAMGYRVDVIHPDADRADFPDAHGVQQAFASESLPRRAYVLASRKRFEQVRAELLSRGASPAALERIAAPAGLDIGARTPEEIALSVMAQIVERRRRVAEKSSPVEKDQKMEQTGSAVDPICGMTVAIATMSVPLIAAEKAPLGPIVAGVVTLLTVMLTVSPLGGNKLPAAMVPLNAPTTLATQRRKTASNCFGSRTRRIRRMVLTWRLLRRGVSIE